MSNIEQQLDQLAQEVERVAIGLFRTNESVKMLHETIGALTNSSVASEVLELRADIDLLINDTDQIRRDVQDIEQRTRER